RGSYCREGSERRDGRGEGGAEGRHETRGCCERWIPRGERGIESQGWSTRRGDKSLEGGRVEDRDRKAELTAETCHALANCARTRNRGGRSYRRADLDHREL